MLICPSFVRCFDANQNIYGMKTRTKKTLIALTIFFFAMAYAFRFDATEIVSFWEGKEPIKWILLASSGVCALLLLIEYLRSLMALKSTEEQ